MRINVRSILAPLSLFVAVSAVATPGDADVVANRTTVASPMQLIATQLRNQVANLKASRASLLAESAQLRTAAIDDAATAAKQTEVGLKGSLNDFSSKLNTEATAIDAQASDQQVLQLNISQLADKLAVMK